MAKKPKANQFETSLVELEGLVERMEEGDLTLEESLKTFERGIELSRSCQKALDEAELRVKTLSEADDPDAPSGIADDT